MTRHRTAAPRSRTWQHGLTLLELMVTIVVAFIVLAAVFLLFEHGAGMARLQSQMAQAETQLRIGMDHLWRDVMRTGFRSTPNSEADRLRNQVCWLPPGSKLLGLTLQTNSGDMHEPSVNVNVEPSAITLFGDLFTPRGHVFHTLSIDQATGQVQIQADALTTAMSNNQFLTLFRPGARWVRITNDDGLTWYSPVVAANYQTLTLTLGGTPATGLCQSGLGDKQDINPVGWIRYRLAEDALAGSLLDPGGDARMTGKTDLIREELDSTGTPVPGSRLTVAEYVVDLQFYDFVFDDTPLGSSNAVYSVANFAADVSDDGSAVGALARTDASARPEDLRFLTAKLSVRTPDEDANFVFLPRSEVNSPLDRFDVHTETDGAARVISLAKRMELRNFWIGRAR